MNLFEDLKTRGLIAQVTNEEKLKDALDNQKITFYMGVEPTADSLHVGHFVQFIIMSKLQKAGHVPIILFGGATAMVGDPSGKTDIRRMMTDEEINHNIQGIKKQAESFIDFSGGKAMIVNNADWLKHLNYISFLREIGVHFTVNRMLSFECYKQRLEKGGLTFFEMNYMLMQSYDYLFLNEKFGCTLEYGGNDQWSNIIGGVELVRKIKGKEVFGMTSALLTTSDGVKMGKTVGGALWLDANKVSPYEFYQYFRNVGDKDVINCLKMLTFLSLDEINELEKLENEQINKAKEVLAFEVTKIVHGHEEATKAAAASKSIFSNSFAGNIPTVIISTKDFDQNNKINIVDLITLSNMASSKSEARRLIEQSGIMINNKKVDHINMLIDISEFKETFIIKKGKKSHKLIQLKNA